MKNQLLQEIKIIFKYICSAGISFGIDLVLFAIFEYLLFHLFGNIAIIIATVLARALSSLANYYINSRHVFKKYDKSSIYKYYTLVIVQMLVSAVSVYLLNFIFTQIPDVAIKFIVDIIIFVVNFIIQKKFIFR